MRRNLLRILMSTGVLAVLTAAPLSAAPIVDVDVDPLGSGAFLYSYTLTNPAESTENVYDFGIYFEGDPFDVTTPDGWDTIFGTGFINWFSLDPSTDLLVGTTLGGFAFSSTLSPGAIRFTSVGADALTGEVGFTEEGPTVGPNPTPIPEPGTLLLLGAGVGTLLARRRRSAPLA